MIVEVISAKTRRIDEGEKRDAYLSIPSVEIYLLVEQDSPGVIAYRRASQGFVREVFQGLDAVVPLACIKSDLPLSEVYEGVQFAPEPEDEI